MKIEQGYTKAQMTWLMMLRLFKRSIKGNWCGGVWQVDAHLKRLQR